MTRFDVLGAAALLSSFCAVNLGAACLDVTWRSLLALSAAPCEHGRGQWHRGISAWALSSDALEPH